MWRLCFWFSVCRSVEVCLWEWWWFFFFLFFLYYFVCGVCCFWGVGDILLRLIFEVFNLGFVWGIYWFGGWFDYVGWNGYMYGWLGWGVSWVFVGIGDWWWDVDYFYVW